MFTFAANHLHSLDMLSWEWLFLLWLIVVVVILYFYSIIIAINAYDSKYFNSIESICINLVFFHTNMYLVFVSICTFLERPTAKKKINIENNSEKKTVFSFCLFYRILIFNVTGTTPSCILSIFCVSLCRDFLL